MLRISGGTFRGRNIRTPGDRIRPTQEKVRQAVFSALMPRMAGCRFLDLFSGSGAVGLEAWSRGAQFVCCVESDPRVFAVLRDNARLLHEKGGEEPGVEGERAVRLVKEDAVRFVERHAAAGPFDIIFADPPYADALRGSINGLLRKTLQAVAETSMLAEDGVFVAEQGQHELPLDCEGWFVTKDTTYGGTRLRFLKR